MNKEELRVFLEIIGCPFPLTKGLFKSLGIPNNWNVMLGILSWIVDFLREKEKIL